MSELLRLKNRLLAKLYTAFPSLAERVIDSYTPWESEGIPWTPATKPLSNCKVSIVTTSGLHHKSQEAFDMKDPEGDPSYRIIDSAEPLSSLMITHDYYDHSDADRDINIVFPVERLRELQNEGAIGGLAERHYSFMGHIDGRHISTLINKSGPEVAGLLKCDNVDIVLLTPG